MAYRWLSNTGDSHLGVPNEPRPTLYVCHSQQFLTAVAIIQIATYVCGVYITVESLVLMQAD